MANSTRGRAPKPPGRGGPPVTTSKSGGSTARFVAKGSQAAKETGTPFRRNPPKRSK